MLRRALVPAVLALAGICLWGAPAPASEAGKNVSLGSPGDGIQTWVEITRNGVRSKAIPRLKIPGDSSFLRKLGDAVRRYGPELRDGSVDAPAPGGTPAAVKPFAGTDAAGPAGAIKGVGPLSVCGICETR